MSGLSRLTRDHAILRTRRRLQRDGFPRLQMALIVALTGGIGFVTSFTLLHAGVHGMALRYPLALAVAYLGFLGLLGLWLRTRASDWLELPNGGSGPSGPRGSGAAEARISSGGGGDFGGGGASADFAAAEASGLADAAPALPEVEVPDVELPSLDDADETTIPLLAVLLAIGLALASLWVVWTAPALLSEVLVDGALSFTLYRHLRRSEPRHWLATAVRRTWIPFLVTAVFLAVAGGVLSAAAPEARSIGEVVRGTGAPR